MSDKEQTLVQMRLVSDGTILAHAHERFTVNLQAKYAFSIACSLAGAMTIRDVIAEDERRASPKVIASLACDIAQQLVNQFEERSWTVPLPDPIPSAEEVALVSERLSLQGAR